MQKVKYREMGLQVVIFILTIGLYTIYWFYQTAEEMKSITSDQEASPTLWTVFLFVPFANLYAYYKYSELYEKIGTENVKQVDFIYSVVVFLASDLVFSAERFKPYCSGRKKFC